MSSTFRVEVNTESVIAQLKRVPAAVGARALKKAVVAGAEEIAVTARVLAPRRSGKLRKKIKGRFHSGTATSAIAGVSYQAGKASRTDAFYGRFLDRGTKQRVRKKGGRTGRVDAKPFLVPAFDQRRGIAIQEAHRVLAAELRKIPPNKRTKGAK